MCIGLGVNLLLLFFIDFYGWLWIFIAFYGYYRFQGHTSYGFEVTLITCYAVWSSARHNSIQRVCKENAATDAGSCRVTLWNWVWWKRGYTLKLCIASKAGQP